MVNEQGLEMIYTASNGYKVDSCNCMCHSKQVVMHMMPCCNLGLYQYVNDDGTVDEDARTQAIEHFAKAQEEYHNRVVPIIVHPHTGEVLVALREWQKKFAIQDVKVTMFMFASDSGRCIYVTQADYQRVRAADHDDYMKNLKGKK